MTFTIRPFSAADYDAVVAAANSAYADATGQPLLPISIADTREADAERPDHIKFGRWVAEVNGRVVGAAEYDQDAVRYHPHKYWVDVYVAREFQRQGIGTALYTQMLASLKQHDPLVARCAIRDDQIHSLAFLQQHGWHEAARMWESYLDLTTFDPTLFAGVEQRMRALGIEIKTLPELADDPNRDRKLYDLVWEIRQDMPSLDPATRPSFEQFVAERLGDKRLIPEAYFVAVHQDVYVGLNNGYHDDSDDRLIHIGQTGVARSWRGRGVAWALKLHGLSYAKAQGYTTVRTTNESTNGSVLAINERLGFTKQPAWIDLIKPFREE